MKDKKLHDMVCHRLKNHEYNLITKNDDCEIWRCQKPGTIIYWFDIVCMKNHIICVGDIQNLIFEYAQGGINFLAGNDVDYYVHSKLAEEYQNQKVLDRDKFCHWISNFMYNKLIENELEAPDNWDRDDPDIDMISDWYDDHEDVLEYRNDGWKAFKEWNMSNQDLDTAEEIIHRYDGEPGVFVDEIDFEVKHSLYMVCEAARRITLQR